MRRVLPDPSDDALSNDELVAAYAVAPEGARHLRMNFVSSADGAATVAGRSAGLSTPGDHRVFQLLRDLADGILVGATTVRDEKYRAPRADADRRARRRALGLAEVPVIAVLSASLTLDPTSSLFTGVEVPTVVLAPATAPAGRRAELAAVADVVTAGAEAVDLAAALDLLASRGLRRILCEGGPHLFGQLLAAEAVDELCLTLSPLLAGPGPRRIVGGQPSPTAPHPLRLLHVLEEDGALLLRYAVDRS